MNSSTIRQYFSRLIQSSIPLELKSCLGIENDADRYEIRFLRKSVQVNFQIVYLIFEDELHLLK